MSHLTYVTIAKRTPWLPWTTRKAEKSPLLSGSTHDSPSKCQQCCKKCDWTRKQSLDRFFWGFRIYKTWIKFPAVLALNRKTNQEITMKFTFFCLFCEVFFCFDLCRLQSYSMKCMYMYNSYMSHSNGQNGRHVTCI